MAYFQGLSQISRGCHVFGLRELDVGAFVDIFASLLSHLGMIVNMYSKLSFYTLSEKYIHKLKRNNGYSWYQDESFENRLPKNEMTFRVPMVKFQNSRMNSVVGSNKRQTPSNLLWKGWHFQRQDVSPSIHVSCLVVSTSLRDQCDIELSGNKMNKGPANHLKVSSTTLNASFSYLHLPSNATKCR